MNKKWLLQLAGDIEAKYGKAQRDYIFGDIHNMTPRCHIVCYIIKGKTRGLKQGGCTMPKVKEIKKTMIEQGISTEIMAQIEFPKQRGNHPEEVLSLINQMDKLLTREQCLAIMEEQGCYKGEGYSAPFITFGLEHTGSTLIEKIKLFNEWESGRKAPCHLNPDGTLSIYWNGWDNEKKQCVCNVIKRLYKTRSGPVDVSATFCGCCAGHVRSSYQLALGVKLRLKEIVSSPISSGGQKRCEFLFEIVG